MTPPTASVMRGPPDEQCPLRGICAGSTAPAAGPGRFGLATERLRMSQPPLSQAILQLERRLGVRLFDRSGRKVTLTETGRAFAAECREPVAAAQHAQEVAGQVEAGLVGTLRLGVV
ncbi:hypothetical protein AQI88_37660 [Streptomyces cellostaticus]|uniref:HTH lysR-type domain-containing protein n=2 Tax=Streptomyces cellostaticus TaxID=67285 RepID=A0A101NE05_9ACTN|nr:LysR family transcriptional regulator [Streptomyces cellostaticus]KUM91259.1 hypothetical protein AQI88_37660 [Streptomyces cellostaticus]